MKKYQYRRIRDLREDNDYNQKHVAEVLKITQQQYQLYESGERELKLHLAVILADYYKVSLDYLTDRTKYKKGLTRSELTEEQAFILRSFGELSEKRQGELLGTLKQLCKEQGEENAKRKDAV